VYYLERKTQVKIASEIGRTKSYVSKRLDKAEKGDMAESIDRYFVRKYTVPEGKNCFWAGNGKSGIREPRMPAMKSFISLIFHKCRG
jgi:hypothetical protein